VVGPGMVREHLVGPGLVQQQLAVGQRQLVADKAPQGASACLELCARYMLPVAAGGSGLPTPAAARPAACCPPRWRGPALSGRCPGPSGATGPWPPSTMSPSPGCGSSSAARACSQDGTRSRRTASRTSTRRSSCGHSHTPSLVNSCWGGDVLFLLAAEGALRVGRPVHQGSDAT
jgi:hypothetical protein